MKSDVKKIKKLYGERFYEDVIRPNFSHLVEKEDFNFTEFLKSVFAPTRGFLDDYKEDPISAGALLDYIYLFSLPEEQKSTHVQETPTKLMKKAGYRLYRCRTVESVERFRKYYQDNELLCTFDHIEDRLENCDIFFAVKINVDEIKREDFKNPQREDEYGTSVISIQFSKFNNIVSIKNRYNHSVLFPDATFANNLNNIIEGLRDSFITHYNLGDCVRPVYRRFYLTNYYQPHGDQYEGYYGPQYRIINHIGRYVYSDNNVVIDTQANDEVTQYDTSRYILTNYYLIDRKENTIKLIDEEIEDDFVKHFDNVQKIDVTSGENGERNIYIHQKNKQMVEIRIDKCNRILSVKDPNVEKIGDKYMQYCQDLKEIEFESLTEVGDDFIANAQDIKKIVLNKLVRAGDNFLYAIPNIYDLRLPKLEVAGKNFLKICARLESLYVPKLEQVGEGSLDFNPKMEEASFESLRVVPTQVLKRYTNLKKIYAPKLENTSDLPSQIINLLTEEHLT